QRGERGQRRERLEGDLVGRPRDGVEMVIQPDRFEAEPVRLPGDLGGPTPGVERIQAVVFTDPPLRDHHTELHRTPPVRLCTVPAMSDLTIRPARSDADLEAWNRVRRIVVWDDTITTIEQMRSMASEPDRIYLLAELAGETVGSGLASDSNLADGFAMPRIIPEHRLCELGAQCLV